MCFFFNRQLVSSYQGKFGSVHYYVKALMERGSQPALECMKNFEVEEPLDVNTPDLLVRNIHVFNIVKLSCDLISHTDYIALVAMLTLICGCF